MMTKYISGGRIDTHGIMYDQCYHHHHYHHNIPVQVVGQVSGNEQASEGWGDTHAIIYHQYHHHHYHHDLPVQAVGQINGYEHTSGGRIDTHAIIYHVISSLLSWPSCAGCRPDQWPWAHQWGMDRYSCYHLSPNIITIITTYLCRL